MNVTSGNANAVLSVQNSQGAQVGFSYSGSSDTSVNFPCGNDTYYIICSSDFIGPPGTPGSVTR